MSAPVPQRVQLHRAMSKLGLCSRTVAWKRIVSGCVRVNGRVITEPLTWVTLYQDRISLSEGSGGDSVEPAAAKELLVLALHKPAGYVTTRRDERGRKTVYDLLPPDLPWVFPAGRLDADSEGLLIFTNDSNLASRLTEPVAHVPKTYHVTVSDCPDEASLSRLRVGIELRDGTTRPAAVRLIDRQDASATLEIILTEGRNRQIRRMCDAIGHPVRRLIRTAIGSFLLGDLPAAGVKLLSTSELSQLSSRRR